MKLLKSALLLLAFPVAFSSCSDSFDPTDCVVTSMGTTGQGGITPVASYPFGMVQMAPDTFDGGTGYRYEHNTIHGFSHTHKSGSGGGSDFLDILFLPFSGEAFDTLSVLPSSVETPFSHDEEISKPGYYGVTLSQWGVKAELTATERCGMHRYIYPADKSSNLLIDLKWGNPNNCTIIAEDQYDTVCFSRIEKVSDYAVKGCRITNGWCPEMHVCFYAEFSRPIREFKLYDHCNLIEGENALEGKDVRAILSFGGDPSKPVEISVGISAVDEEGAQANRFREVGKKSFDVVAKAAHKAWVKQLSTLEVSDPYSEKGKTMYTCYYYSLLYPMLYSDVDGRFRSSDRKVHKGDFKYYAGVLGLWDIFRAHLPLIAVIRPDIATDLMKTFLEHYDNCGQLPIWVLAGQDTYCMEGYHSAPVVADFYSKGIRGFDEEKMLDALQVSACRDTFGFFCRAYRGATNYLKYHYVPYDLEISSSSKTLEYCYDDWCISKFAGMLGNAEVEKEYLERSRWYGNLFDKSTNLMRPKDSEGNFKEPFDPFYSNHLRPDDHFMEGTAWHWTFHVPQDPEGLMELMGGREPFVQKLDSMFFVLGREVHGPHPSGDMTGMIGHYSQGNEPGHHTIYLYNVAGEPWKTQKLVTRVVDELYSTKPDGICGNDDTGQMSAWYVWNSLGFYPMTHGDATYMIGSPQHEKMILHHSNGDLTIEAPGVSSENCYIKSITLNGKPYEKYYISHSDIFNGDATVHFEMTSTPCNNQQR